MQQQSMVFPRAGDPRLQAFLKFHERNPQIYRLFCRFTNEALAAGRPRFSARTVIHRIRWYTMVETKDPAGFKINNNWSPFYARLFVEDFPEHRGIFEMRTAVADDMARGGT